MSIKTLKRTISELLVLSVQAKGMVIGLEKADQPVDENDARDLAEMAKVLIANCDTVDMVVGNLRRVAPYSKNFIPSKK